MARKSGRAPHFHSSLPSLVSQESEGLRGTMGPTTTTSTEQPNLSHEMNEKTIFILMGCGPHAQSIRGMTTTMVMMEMMIMIMTTMMIMKIDDW